MVIHSFLDNVINFRKRIPPSEKAFAHSLAALKTEGIEPPAEASAQAKPERFIIGHLEMKCPKALKVERFCWRKNMLQPCQGILDRMRISEGPKAGPE